ncbi:MAG: hypothetical protein IIW02_00415 [Clostridia bacterium]|nr:hypothetical protein [Clostridia bacterium]
MRKSQIVALIILILAVTIIIFVGSCQDREPDNTQSLKPTIAPATPTVAAPTPTVDMSTQTPEPTATPVQRPVISDYTKYDDYSKDTLKLATKDKVNADDEVVFADRGVTEALNGLDYILSNPGSNSTTDVYVCIMLNSYKYNDNINAILDFARASSVKLSFFATASYLSNSENYEVIRTIYRDGHTLGVRGNFSTLSHQGLCDTVWNLEVKYQTILQDASFRTNFYTPEKKEFSQRDVVLLNAMGYTPVFRYQGLIDSTTKDKTYDGVVLRAYMGESDYAKDSTAENIISYITWGLQQGYKFAGLSK